MLDLLYNGITPVQRAEMTFQRNSSPTNVHTLKISHVSTLTSFLDLERDRDILQVFSSSIKEKKNHTGKNRSFG